jgi:NTP pyrophosphatase (non-canonical NTP hydrolase)
MEKEERKKLYKKAIDTWGIEAQRNMAFEELGELNTALARDRRGRVTKEEIITELADVTIMCEQLAFFLGYEDYEKEMDNKLERLRDEKLAKYEANEAEN